MKRKPSGQKYRNLTARGGVIYYQRRVGGKRVRFSCNTNDWQEAAAVARLYEERKGIGRLPFAAVETPTFREFAKRYLEEDTGHLAETTLSDRRVYLGEEGHLLSTFGDLRLDEIGVPQIRLWWNEQVVGAGRSTKTGRGYLDLLASILGYACVLEILERGRESLRDGEVDGEIAGVQVTVPTGGSSMSIQTGRTKTGCDGATGETSKFPECCDPEPPERRDKLFSANRRYVERCKECLVVLDQKNWWIAGCFDRCLFRSKRPPGDPDPESVSGHLINLLDHPFDERTFAAVVLDSSSDRHEDQPRFHDLYVRDEFLDRCNNPLERNHLGRVVAFNRHNQRADSLGLTSSHPTTNPGSERGNVNCFDPTVDADRLAGIIRRRSGSPQRPLRIPHAECSSHRPPSQSFGSFPALPSRKPSAAFSAGRSGRVHQQPRSMRSRVLQASGEQHRLAPPDQGVATAEESPGSWRAPRVSESTHPLPRQEPQQAPPSHHRGAQRRPSPTG